MTASNGAQDRFAILVLGMHRSGTSAVARIVNLFGADLPKRMMPAASSNSEGHFEPLEIVNLHDELLASVGSSWSDWSAFPENWYDTNESGKYVDKLSEEALVDFPDQNHAIIKDPRILRFIPIWLKVLEKIALKPFGILPFRDPFEVAASLSARNDIPMDHGYLLWLRHVLDAEFHTRELSRTFVSYDQLLTRKTETLKNLFDTLPIAHTAQIDQIIDKASKTINAELRHNNSANAALSAKFEMPRLVHLAHEMHERFLIDPYDSIALSTLDSIRNDFDKYTSISKAVFKSLHAPGYQSKRDQDLLNEQTSAIIAQQIGQIGQIREVMSEHRTMTDGIVERLTAIGALHEDAVDQTQSMKSKIEILDAEINQAKNCFGSQEVADRHRDEKLHQQQMLIESLVERLSKLEDKNQRGGYLKRLKRRLF